MSTRTLKAVIPSVATSDGAGVRLRRSLGAGAGARVDPFLMLDEFYSDDPRDYIAGFPDHPHRGFETVTYMLDGRMLHQDHMGNRGELGPGDVQWMTAARGIIHSEMPQQEQGRMRGFQLWLNLPSAEKMKPAGYRDIPSSQIPARHFDGGQVRVIAGAFAQGGQVTEGPMNTRERPLSTDPLMLDVHLDASASLVVPVTEGHSAAVYLYEGSLSVGDRGDTVPHRSAGVLTDGDSVHLAAGEQGARLLLLAARPLNEPVAQYGPFVMNTREELEQAVADFRAGRLTS